MQGKRKNAESRCKTNNRRSGKMQLFLLTSAIFHLTSAMLSLSSPSSARWLRQVDTHLEEILIDHAHCEKKAAGTAMNFLFYYVEHEELARAMTEIVNEELAHFHMVLDLLAKRG